MARSINDLKSLIIEGAEYRETVQVTYLGNEFDVPIKPLTDEDLTKIQREISKMQSLMTIVQGKLASEIKKGNTTPTPEEMAKLKEKVTNEVLNNKNLDVSELSEVMFKVNQMYCKFGIDDPDIAKLVPEFRFGLTELIGKRIEVISSVPPQVIANFFDQPTATKSS
jgi:hypothetical protein